MKINEKWNRLCEISEYELAFKLDEKKKEKKAEKKKKRKQIGR